MSPYAGRPEVVSIGHNDASEPIRNGMHSWWLAKGLHNRLAGIWPRRERLGLSCFPSHAFENLQAGIFGRYVGQDFRESALA